MKPLESEADVDLYCDQLAKSGTEHAHQRSFFAWLAQAARLGWNDWGNFAFAIPNGGKRDAITAARLKSEGVKPGVPDICYPLPLVNYHGLWIEMKVKDGKRSDKQSDWHINLRACGHAVATCWGWRAARQCFVDYNNGQTVEEEYR